MKPLEFHVLLTQAGVLRWLGRRLRFPFQNKAPVNKPSSSTPSDATSDYELEVELRWWQRFVQWLRSRTGIIVAVAVLLLVGFGWNGQAIYKGVKLWRAGRLVAQSEKAGRANNYAEQFALLRRAFVIAPSTPLTMRAAARYHESRGEAAALPLYESLLATPEATPEDLARACRLAFTFGRIEFAKKWLAELRRDDAWNKKPLVISLEAQLAAVEGKWPQALDLGRNAAADPSAGGEEKLVFAMLLTRADAASAAERGKLRGEAIDILVSLMNAPDDSGARAVMSLVSLARDPAAAALLAGRDVTAWVEAATRHPSLAPQPRVAAWDLLLVARPADRDQTFSDFLAKWRDGPLPERLAAARWLNQHNKPAMSLQLSELQLDVSSDWFLVHLDALAATGRWDAVLEKLQNPAGSAAAMPAVLRAVFSMRARTELGQKFDKSEAWRDIHLLVPGETVQNKLYVAQYAEKVGEGRQAALIFRRLLDEARPGAKFQMDLSKEEKFACYSAMIRLTPGTAPAAELLPLFEGLVEEFPDMAEAVNDAIYLRLITEGPAESMRARLRDLLEKNRAVLAYRTTAALYELRSGNPAGAAQIYDGWQIDWTTAQDRFKAVRVAVLDAVGKKDDAKTLRETIDAKRLRPEEVKLLEAKP